MPTLVTKNIRLYNSTNHTKWVNIQAKKNAVGEWKFHEVTCAHGYHIVSAKTIVDLTSHKSHVLVKDLQVQAAEIDQVSDDPTKAEILRKSEAIMRKRDILTDIKDDLMKQSRSLSELTIRILWVSPHIKHST